MKTIIAAAIAAVALGGAAQAGDAANGESVFAKRCKTCHSIISPSGEQIVKGGKTGPNQWGTIGKPAGSHSDFDKYGASLVAAGAAGLVWTEEEVVKYLEDPRAYLQEKTGDPKARSLMAFKLRDEGERADVAAYLAQFK